MVGKGHLDAPTAAATGGVGRRVQEAQSIRVLCVDEVEVITSSLRTFIDHQPDMVCVGCMSSASGLIEKVSHLDPSPDVVLLDATMPGRDPFIAMCDLAVSCKATRTIIYTGQQGEEICRKAMANGARGCVSKHDALETLLEAIRRVARGEMYFSGLQRVNG